MAYLYGAAAQGIQGYIFATNKLKEMVGASEAVESLCTKTFRDFLRGLNCQWEDGASAPKQILGAAGNIKWIFPEKTLLECVVREFPMHVRKMIPGLSVSQAVVPFDGILKPEHLDKLEQKLKAQRNRPVLSTSPDWAACTRCPRTGHPAFENKGSELLDEALATKAAVASKDSPMTRLASKLLNGTPDGSPVYRPTDLDLRFPYNLEEIIKGRDNTWLAVIHADGNGLGVLIQKINRALDQLPDKTAETFARFSEALDKATALAAKTAFDEVIVPAIDSSTKHLPLRPLILGGDDLTLIIRADLAIPFTTAFLKAFNEHTATHLKCSKELTISGIDQGLTACAGIAFIKHSYPFHYGYELAESLCTAAKKSSKSSKQAHDTGSIPSSLSFLKVQSAFSENWDTIRERELLVSNFKDGKALHFDYGPYVIDEIEGMESVTALQKVVSVLTQPNAPVSGLRRWLSLLYDEPADSPFFLERLKMVTGEDFDDNALSNAFEALGAGLRLNRPYISRSDAYASPVVDILTVLGMEQRSQETNK